MSWDKIPNHVRLKTIKFLKNKKNSIYIDSDLYFGLSEAIEELQLWCYAESKEDDFAVQAVEDLTSQELENFFNKLGI